MSIYGFWQGPSYRPSTRDELFGAALEQPMSLGATFWDQAKGGVLESFGLGTAIRTLSLPPAAQTRRGRETDAEYQARQERVKGITEEEYKASPYYRDGVPWDSGMTEDRAAALATMYDAKRVREYFAEKRPIAAFFGNLAGQATDPINYIPVAGPSVKAAAVARMGVVKGVAATAALDAAANTAIAGLATRETRRSFGDDVSWQAMVSEIATAALLGTAFGTVGGLLERRAGLRADAMRSQAEVKVQTLKATQEARIALNEAIGGLANDGEVRLSPNAVAPIERVAGIGDANPFGLKAVTRDEAVRLVAGKTEKPGGVDPALQVDAAINNGKSLKVGKLPVDLIAPNEAGKLYDATVNEARAQEYAARTGDAPPIVATVSRSGEIRVIDGGHRITAARMRGDAFIDAVVSELPAKASDSSLNRTASWVIRDKATGQAVMETFNPKLAERVNTDKYEAVPIGQYLGEINGQPKRVVDASPARPEAPPQGRAEAEVKVAKPENYKALADQYRVDPEAGTFPEEAELRQLAQEGRLSEEDMAVLNGADEAWQDSVAYSKALDSVVGCLV